MPLRHARKRDLLRHHSLIRTNDPDRLRELLIEVYKARDFRVERGGEDFFGQINRLQLRDVELAYSAYNAEAELEIPETGGFRQQICLAGGGETTIDGRRFQLSIEESCVIPLGAKVETRFGASYRQLVLRLDPEVLRRKLEAIVGGRLTGALEFRSAADFRSPWLSNMRRLTLFLAEEADSQDSQFAPLALAEFEQALIVACLCGNPHNFSHLLEGPLESPAPWQIQRTEAYIEANWDQPLTFEAISDAVGVSIRSIFHAFRVKRGYSPMTFLKQIRLARARDMLRRTGADNSVTEVAFRCGFQSHGHFAKEYKRRFGELPSDTLARARIGDRSDASHVAREAENEHP